MYIRRHNFIYVDVSDGCFMQRKPFPNISPFHLDRTNKQ